MRLIRDGRLYVIGRRRQATAAAPVLGIAAEPVVQLADAHLTFQRFRM
jgi:hypothetical protein